MDKPQIILLPKRGSTALGYISVVEKELAPFDIKRVYWTYYSPHEVIRGNHAHKKLKQLIFAVSGRINFHLEDLNQNSFDFQLEKPEQGLYIPPLHWRTIQFSHNAVLLCLASEVYDEQDYIRSYQEFKSYQG
jgi:dTDP-4-dehydrorhamnose 3,5-epimerase-like enzyme